MGSYFLCSYKPLCSTAAGRAAIASSGLPPFIDGSCRREPDFQAQAPSISALCRSTKFAPRLRLGSHVVYITAKSRYNREPGWAFVASLNIIERFETHLEAAQWYQAQGYALPSNCHVPGNLPQPFHLTSQGIPKEVVERVGKNPDPVIAVRLWDATYAIRARNCGVYLACKSDFLELNDPPILREADFYRIFGHVPGTQNPPKITKEQYHALMKFKDRRGR